MTQTPSPGSSHEWATFTVAGETFGLPVEVVQEVLMEQPVTPVPLAAPHVSGLLVLRGQLMPAIDLRRFFGMPERARDAPHRVIVTTTAGRLQALVADDVGDVVKLPPERWIAPPQTMKVARGVTAICPVDGDVVLALDPGAVDPPDQVTGSQARAR
jgi:purine-binding chemotaxis protein CheW